LRFVKIADIGGDIITGSEAADQRAVEVAEFELGPAGFFGLPDEASAISEKTHDRQVILPSWLSFG